MPILQSLLCVDLGQVIGSATGETSVPCVWSSLPIRADLPLFPLRCCCLARSGGARHSLARVRVPHPARFQPRTRILGGGLSRWRARHCDCGQIHGGKVSQTAPIVRFTSTTDRHVLRRPGAAPTRDGQVHRSLLAPMRASAGVLAAGVRPQRVTNAGLVCQIQHIGHCHA
jgi:hypothetical protein